MIDDLVDVFLVHTSYGVWGTFASALFAMENNVEDTLFVDKDLDENAQYSLFIGLGSFLRIVVHLAALVVIIMWTAFTNGNDNSNSNSNDNDNSDDNNCMLRMHLH